MIKTIVETAVEWACKHLGALQICWLCLVATIGVGWFVNSQFARASDVEALSEIVTELRADAISKRIFDYRVRQCDTPAIERQQKRWLAEQLKADQDRYQQITKRDFQLPACGDL